LLGEGEGNDEDDEDKQQETTNETNDVHGPSSIFCETAPAAMV